MAISAKASKSLKEPWHDAGKVVNWKKLSFPAFPCCQILERGTPVEGYFKKVKSSNDRKKPVNCAGLGQLSLVEHALCPLDPQASLVENLVHETCYQFMDKNRHWAKANVRVICPMGLSANDEFYLWGLLALTFWEKETDAEFHATPHFCLRKLGMIDSYSRSGGKQYRQFAQAMERLSLVRYQNDHFYDPIRGEHRKVSFGFFSYSLPLNPESSRAWRIAWDPIFFEFVKASSGHLRFDLDVYRQLDPACRRLFLVLAKIFHRCEATPSFDLRHLAVDVLGFSASLIPRDWKRKVVRCVQCLREMGIVDAHSGDLCFQKLRTGRYALTLRRGPYFTKPARPLINQRWENSPLLEPLQKIGFTEATIPALVRKYPSRLLREWIDITLAALERNGPGFFTKSAQAYFLDNVKHAAQGTRTAPDWWLDLRKAEYEFIGKEKLVRLAGSPSSKDGQMESAHAILKRIWNETSLPATGDVTTQPGTGKKARSAEPASSLILLQKA